MENPDLTKLTFRFITFRASSDNPSFLTNFLDLLLPKLRAKCPAYALGIEKDGTPDRHVHIMMGRHTFGDTQKFNDFVFFKAMKDFKNATKDWSTIWEHAYKPKEVVKTTEDTMRVLGYCLKDEYSAKENKGFSKDFIEESIKFQLAVGRVKNITPSHLRDWKILTKKNAHNWIMDFIHKNNTTVRDPLLIFKMRQQCYSFCDLTSKAQKEILDDILIESKLYDEKTEKLLQLECMNKIEDGEYSNTGTYKQQADEGLEIKDDYFELVEENERLLKIIEELKLELKGAQAAFNAAISPEYDEMFKKGQ